MARSIVKYTLNSGAIPDYIIEGGCSLDVSEYLYGVTDEDPVPEGTHSLTAEAFTELVVASDIERVEFDDGDPMLSDIEKTNEAEDWIAAFGL